MTEDFLSANLSSVLIEANASISWAREAVAVVVMVILALRVRAETSMPSGPVVSNNHPIRTMENVGVDWAYGV